MFPSAAPSQDEAVASLLRLGELRRGDPDYAGALS